MLNSEDLTTLFSSTRRDAQGLFPQLVRRLILATCSDSDLPQFQMASGDDIRLHGWDGRMTSTVAHPWLPLGPSAWEMGVGDPEDKAEKDYKKRSETPGEVVPATTTFVFVTPRVWAGGERWAERKRAERTWANIRVIHGADLATWLERAPAIAVWVAGAMGRPIRGLNTPERFWDTSVTHLYGPNLTTAVIVGGRSDAREKLLRFLQSSEAVVSLVGETVEEAALFATAVCLESMAPERRARVLVVSDASVSEHLATLSQDLVAVLVDAALYPAMRSDALRHVRFVIPEGRGARANRLTAAIDIGPLSRKATATALQSAGHKEEQADRMTASSRGSLQALLWIVAKPERGALAWSRGQSALELAPLALAGQWTVEAHPDHEVLATLAGRDYSEIRQTLAIWSGPGLPLERRGSIWDWKAWEFVWMGLAPSLQRADIDRFLKVANEVLGAPDPALELAPEDRWLAQMRGKTHRFSGALRHGFARSLALLAVNSDLVPGVNGRALVNRFVFDLLVVEERAKRWISIAQWLPDLAEAAPDAFLDALDRFIDDQGAVRELFTEGGMFGSSPHTHVLWSLERIAWSQDHFSRVVLALGRLSAVDPGGTLSNRPARSLRLVFLPWRPATGMPIADRIRAMRLLFDAADDVAWSCAASLLPATHDHPQPFAPPAWRDWGQDRSSGVSPRDYWTFQEQLVDLLLERAGSHSARWAQLLQAAPEILRKHRELGIRITEAIRSLDSAGVSRTDTFVLGDAARAIVMRHKRVQNAEWALKGEDLVLFQALRAHLAPRHRRDRDRWLFAHWPEIVRDLELSPDEREKRVTALRKASLADVLAEDGLAGVLEWAAEVESAEALGITLAAWPEHEAKVLDAGLSELGEPRRRPAAARLAYGFCFGRHRAGGDAWRTSMLNALRPRVNSAALAFVLQAFPCNQDTWNAVENEAAEVRAQYWREVGVFVLSLPKCEFAISRLVAANRPYRVIDLASMLLRDDGNQDDAEVTGRKLAQARVALTLAVDHLPMEERDVGGSMSYDLNRLLDFLEKNGASREDLASWEWKWLPLIDEEDRNLRALQAELSEKPELFVDFLKCVYRASGSNETDRVLTESEMQRASLARELLEAWTRIPGLDAGAREPTHAVGEGLGPISPAWNGTIDEAALLSWLGRAVTLAREASRIEVCYARIGRLFAYGPADADGIWPCAPVRRAIEQARSDELDDELVAGVMSRRGAHWVARDGAQESTMATAFRRWCEEVRAQYPRTGTILRRLAEYYEREARDERERWRLVEFNE